MMKVQKVTLRRVVTLAVYHDPESDHIKLDVDTPTPLSSAARKRDLARLLRRALEKLEDRIAWDHVDEVLTRTTPPGN